MPQYAIPVTGLQRENSDRESHTSTHLKLILIKHAQKMIGDDLIQPYKSKTIMIFTLAS